MDSPRAQGPGGHLCRHSLAECNSWEGPGWLRGARREKEGGTGGEQGPAKEGQHEPIIIN